jgi:DNA primase
MSQVDQIKSKLDIVTVVGSYIKLEKAGLNWKGKCPFHNERTPSFFVSPDRGGYYCFGCHAKGDIFTFVQEFEGLDFVGALKVLAEKAGVPLEEFRSEKKTEKEKLFSVMEQATLYYQNQLQGNKKVEEYLKTRGIKSSTISEFRIGFAPEGWRELYQHLLNKGVTAGEMMSCGLIKRMEGAQNSFYDTFRGRIVFPIGDSSGRVVGFSGRILVSDDKSPKYLNSPETVLFNKSEILFGLDKAKRHIKEHDYSVLVEGQMDLVMMHQVGITNTVATSGTALTQDQLVKLRRLSNRIIICYDGDSAGFNASNRSSKIALSLGMDLKVAQMPQGKDPADLAKESPSVLAEALKNSKHIIDFYTDSLLEKKISGRELGEEIRKNVLPYVTELPSAIEKSHFMKTIAQRTFIKEEALWDDLKNIAKAEVVIPKEHNQNVHHGKIETLEKRIIGILWWQKGNKISIEGVDVKDLEKRAKDILGEKFEEIEKELEKNKDALLFETESYYNGKQNLKSEIEELLLSLEEEYLKKKFSLAMNNLQKSEQIKDSGRVLSYLEECQRLSSRINAIKVIRSSYEK